MTHALKLDMLDLVTPVVEQVEEFPNHLVDFLEQSPELAITLNVLPTDTAGKTLVVSFSDAFLDLLLSSGVISANDLNAIRSEILPENRGYTLAITVLLHPAGGAVGKDCASAGIEAQAPCFTPSGERIWIKRYRGDDHPLCEALFEEFVKSFEPERPRGGKIISV